MNIKSRRFLQPGTLRNSLFAAGLLVSQAVFAVPQTINDLYVGSDAHGHGDVIGDPALFQITKIVAERTGTNFTVDVYTNFANAGLGSFERSTIPGGIAFGDLFLADEWTPLGSQPYAGDNWSTGTDWDYGFSLDDRWVPGGTGTWYELNDPTKNADIELSDAFIGCCTFRNGQEVAVDRSNAYVSSLAAGTWSVNDVDHIISFSMNLAGTTLENADTIGIHWAMTCGNDTIEGAYDNTAVPEPGSIALFGLGLLGLATLRRRVASHF